MMLEGDYYQPRHSQKHPAKVSLLEGGEIVIETLEQTWAMPLAEVELKRSVGREPIKLCYPDGGCFVPSDSAAFQRLIKPYQSPSLLARAEKHIGAVLVSFVLLVGLTVGFFTHGIGWLSSGVVAVWPNEFSVALGERVLSTMDKQMLQPSSLSEDTKQDIREAFADAMPSLEGGIEPRLVFRDWQGGANAFALSDGTIIVMDDLVELAETSEQLNSVLFHEVGHIHHQHVIKGLVSSALLSTAVAVITGEGSGLLDTFAGGAVFLMNQGHSRESELEADQYAIDQMNQYYGTTLPMVEMFELFQDQQMIYGSAIPQLLSTHPDLDERIGVIAGSSD